MKTDRLIEDLRIRLEIAQDNLAESENFSDRLYWTRRFQEISEEIDGIEEDES